MWQDAGIDSPGNKKHLAFVKRYFKFETAMDRHNQKEATLNSELDKLIIMAKKLGITQFPSQKGTMVDLGLDFMDYRE